MVKFWNLKFGIKIKILMHSSKFTVIYNFGQIKTLGLKMRLKSVMYNGFTSLITLSPVSFSTAGVHVLSGLACKSSSLVRIFWSFLFFSLSEIEWFNLTAKSKLAAPIWDGRKPRNSAFSSINRLNLRDQAPTFAAYGSSFSLSKPKIRLNLSRNWRGDGYLRLNAKW